MKIDRLIGIITTLLQKEKVTAPYLAQKFEVSRRTISRDIETICMAGIPIVTEQGYHGGMYIAEGYKLDRSLLTQEDLQAVFAGLKGIDSVMAKPKSNKLAEKMSLKKNQVFAVQENIVIDLASHYKDSITEKIGLLREAIKEHRLVSFSYYYEKGEDLRVVEPYLIVFQWSSWYVYGYCTKRKDFRLFKLNRLWKLELCNDQFEPREIPQEDLDFHRVFTEEIKLTALFHPHVKHRLIDEYGPDCYKMEADGRLLATIGFTFYDHMLQWVLSFGNKIEVLEPEELRQELRKQGEDLVKFYQGT